MMALYMPMQPSSKTPMMALFAGAVAPVHGRFLPRRLGTFRSLKRCDMTVVVSKQPAFQPSPQPFDEELILKIGTPERAVLNAGFGKRAVEVQHAHQSGPLAAPIRNREDRTLDGSMSPGKT